MENLASSSYNRIVRVVSKFAVIVFIFFIKSTEYNVRPLQHERFDINPWSYLIGAWLMAVLLYIHVSSGMIKGSRSELTDHSSNSNSTETNSPKTYPW